MPEWLQHARRSTSCPGTSPRTRRSASAIVPARRARAALPRAARPDPPPARPGGRRGATGPAAERRSGRHPRATAAATSAGTRRSSSGARSIGRCGLRRIGYRFVGDRAARAFRGRRRRRSTPAFAKTMAHRYFGRDLLYERILWLPPTRPAARSGLDGAAVPVRNGWPEPGRRRRGRARRCERLRLARGAQPDARGRGVRRPSAPGAAPARPRLAPARGSPAAAVRDGASATPGSSWTASTTPTTTASGCSSTCAATRPDINAWFVLERGTPDWERLRAAGERRLVAHGSFALEDADAQLRVAALVARRPADRPTRRDHRGSPAADRGVRASSSTA